MLKIFLNLKSVSSTRDAWTGGVIASDMAGVGGMMDEIHVNPPLTAYCRVFFEGGIEIYDSRFTIFDWGNWLGWKGIVRFRPVSFGCRFPPRFPPILNFKL